MDEMNDNKFDIRSLENQPTAASQVSIPVRSERIPVSEYVGQLFAQGEAVHGIATKLLEEGYTKTQEEALQAIRAVYASWRDVEEQLDSEVADLKNWHIMLRHELLKKTMETNPRAALAILESLAEIQQIKTIVETDLNNIPITVQLIPRIDTPPEDPTGAKPTETTSEHIKM